MTITINGTTGVTYPAGGTDNVAGSGVGTTDTQTLTNKTLTSPTITGATITGGAVAATSGPTSTQLAGNRNKIINGAMMIDQRNAGASVTITVDGTYTLDRWVCSSDAASKYSVQQSTTSPTGYKNSLAVTSLSAYSVPSNQVFGINQYIEGLNCADLSWGTASAATVTVSFFVNSSITGTFGGVLRNSAGNRAYPFTYTISSANTWEQKNIVISGDTSGTWLTTNGVGIRIIFGLGVGSTYAGTAGSWSSSNLYGATGAQSVVGTNGATFYITGVQLEKGATATPFENRLYGTELALCQRYYFRRTSTGTNDVLAVLSAYSQTGLWGKFLDYHVTMRASPTVSVSSVSHISAWNAATTVSSTASAISTFGANPDSLVVQGAITLGSSILVAGNSSVATFNTTSGWIDASAEL